jgi:hypothetical protein
MVAICPRVTRQFPGVCDEARVPCPAAPGPLERYAARFDDLFGSLAPRERNKTLTALTGAEPVTGASFHHDSCRDKPSTDTARDTIRKTGFKPTSRRSSHLRPGQDRPGRLPNARLSRSPSAGHLPRWHRFSAPTPTDDHALDLRRALENREARGGAGSFRR